MVAKGTMIGAGFRVEFVMVQAAGMVTFSGKGVVIAVAIPLFGMY